MTGRTAIATAHWRRLDIEGTDRCTLSRLEHGWMLVGQAIWHEDGTDANLTYDVRCGPDWTSLSADVSGEVAGRALALRLRRGAGGWLLNDEPQADTSNCPDLDLSFTPATNLLPLRRLTPTDGHSASVCAAWLLPDFATIARLDQTYTWIEAGKVSYTSPSFTADLDVHETGFVTRYPDLWEGWVDG
ncbi:MAG: putative glycolipid-binding domain-containing protein [Ruegeria sp.]